MEALCAAREPKALDHAKSKQMSTCSASPCVMVHAIDRPRLSKSSSIDILQDNLLRVWVEYCTAPPTWQNITLKIPGAVPKYIEAACMWFRICVCVCVGGYNHITTLRVLYSFHICISWCCRNTLCTAREHSVGFVPTVDPWIPTSILFVPCSSQALFVSLCFLGVIPPPSKIAF